MVTIQKYRKQYWFLKIVQEEIEENQDSNELEVIEVKSD